MHDEVEQKLSVNPFDYFNRVISHTTEPLIGLEYIILFPHPKLTIKPFHCALCDKAYDENLIKNHLISNFHRGNYLNLSFPSLFNFLQSKRRYSFDINEREVILTQISRNLQPYLNQIKPSVVDFEELKENRTKIVKEKRKIETFNEKNLEKFMEILLKNIKNLNDDESMEIDDLEFFDLPTASFNYNKIEIYNSQAAGIEIEINEKYKTYREQPDNHPEFTENWEIFYTYRDQLVRNHKSVTDWTPYWQKFWIVRIEELKQQEIFEGKLEIMQRINLSMNDLLDYQESQRAHVFKPHELENHQFKSDGDSDSDYGKEYQPSCIRGPGIIQPKRKRRCIVTELHQKTNDELLNPKNFERDSPGTLFSIVRHLVAMQNELGYIVNSIKKFYILSAEMEKEKAYSSENLLNDEESFLIFTLVTLKLRTVIDSKDFVNWKMRGVTRTLQQLGAMLSQSNYRYKTLNKEYKRCLELIKIPYVKNEIENDEENLEIARIVTQFLGEQGVNFETEDIEMIVQDVKNEICKNN